MLTRRTWTPTCQNFEEKIVPSKFDFFLAWNIQQLLPMLSVSAFSSRCTIGNRVFWDNVSFPEKHCWVRFRVFNFAWVPSATFFLNVNCPSSCDHRLSPWAARPLIPGGAPSQGQLPGLHGAARNPAASPSSALQPWVSTHKFLVLNVLNSSLVVRQTTWLELNYHGTILLNAFH